MNILIRKGTKEDLPAVHDLVRDLAVYEKAEEQLIATVEDYRRDFEKGWFECEVAVNAGQIIGVVLYYETYSTWKGRMLYLEDFVVKESFRQHGVGQLLFDAYLKTAKDKCCNLVKWQVLDWNTPAVNFYRKNNATIEKEWWNGKIIF